jgi:multidrug efflux pump subunit AcrA (membrane-fusion protein)
MDDFNFSSGKITPTPNAHHGQLIKMTASETTARELILPVPSSPVSVPEDSDMLVPLDRGDCAIFRTTTPTEFLPRMGRWHNVGGFIMVACLGGAVALSTVLKYNVTVQAPASIRPAGELRLVQSTIEGSIVNIFVRENQTVRQRQQIATVQDLRLESKLQTKRSQFAGDMRKVNQQINAIDQQIIALDQQATAEQDRSNRSIAGIQSELSRAKRDHHDKQITTQTEVTEAQANRQTVQAEQQVAHSELQVAQANLKSLQAGHQSALVRAQRYQEAAAAGGISMNQLEEVRLAAAQQAQAIAAQIATIDKQQQNVLRVKQIAAAAQSRVQRTQVALNPSATESATIAQKIAAEQANAQAALARFQQDRQKLLQQRLELTNQLTSIDRDVAQIAIDLKPIAILAPVSGKIQELNLRNKSQVVRPGDRIAQILPTSSPLQIKAAVAIADIDNVQVGYAVKMRVSACPYSDYGVISGKVQEVAADAKSVDRSLGNTAGQLSTAVNGIYEVTIAPDHLALHQSGKVCQVRSGMDGRVDIMAKEESVFQFMLRKARLWDRS